MACPFANLQPNAPDADHAVSPDGNGHPTSHKSVSKCPLGYDSGSSFKLGPLSCVICRALLFNASKCVPCGHIYCRFCISRFQDCPLCGADIESTEADDELQKQVDKFIEGHARVKRSITQVSGSEGEDSQSNVVYEDVSLERGTFLVQQAMRAFQAQNVESASARLTICAADIKEELVRNDTIPEICSQLGAVLGMLGDCRLHSEDLDEAFAFLPGIPGIACLDVVKLTRSMCNEEDALNYYSESADMLSQLPEKDDEIVHALSVSLNKMGDLKYYADDLQSAREHYAKALKVRQDALTNQTELSSQVLDVAVSLAKVADVDRALGNNQSAGEGFQEAIKLLENLSIKSKDNDSLERRRSSVLDFLHGQLKST